MCPEFKNTTKAFTLYIITQTYKHWSRSRNCIAGTHVSLLL